MTDAEQAAPQAVPLEAKQLPRLPVARTPDEDPGAAVERALEFFQTESDGAQDVFRA